jgi:hypothetical protein
MDFNDGYSFGYDQIYVNPIKETYATYDNSIIKPGDPSANHFNSPKGKAGNYGGYAPISDESGLFSDISQITKMENEKISRKYKESQGDVYEHMERSIRASERQKLEGMYKLDEMSKKLADFQYKHDIFLIFIIFLVIYILMHNNNNNVGGYQQYGVYPPYPPMSTPPQMAPKV